MDANRQGRHADAAVDVEGRALDLVQALDVLVARSVSEPGPVQEGEVDLAAVSMSGQDQVEGLSGEVGHDVGRVGQQQPAHAGRHIGDGFVELIVAAGRVVDTDNPEAGLELLALVDQEVDLGRGQGVLEVVDCLRRVVPVARHCPDAAGSLQVAEQVVNVRNRGRGVDQVAGDEDHVRLQGLHLLYHPTVEAPGLSQVEVGDLHHSHSVEAGGQVANRDRPANHLEVGRLVDGAVIGRRRSGRGGTYAPEQEGPPREHRCPPPPRGVRWVPARVAAGRPMTRIAT